MALLNKQGSCNMTGNLDVVVNSISLIKPDGTIEEWTLGGNIATVHNPTFTGTVNGVTKDSIGLDNVDNTSDLNKPVSTATQNAINTVVSNTNTTFTSQLALINGHTNSINNINTTLTSPLGLLNSNGSNLSSLITSTNNTFTSQLGLINANKASISTLNAHVST